jgi:hypothetical protein
MKRRWCCGVIAIALIVIPTGTSNGTPQSESSVRDTRDVIKVGVDLTLGMPEDLAIKRIIEAGYGANKLPPTEELRKRGVTSMWGINQKTGTIESAIGLALFANGKLWSASHEWPDVDNTESIALGKKLFFLLSDFERQGNRNCTIEAFIAEVPDYSTKTAFLHCGHKNFAVYLQKYRDQPETVQFNEELVSSVR